MEVWRGGSWVRKPFWGSGALSFEVTAFKWCFLDSLGLAADNGETKSEISCLRLALRTNVFLKCGVHSRAYFSSKLNFLGWFGIGVGRGIQRTFRIRSSSNIKRFGRKRINSTIAFKKPKNRSKSLNIWARDFPKSALDSLGLAAANGNPLTCLGLGY